MNKTIILLIGILVLGFALNVYRTKKSITGKRTAATEKVVYNV